MNDVERLIFLMDEICVLKSKIKEHGTGHIHTAKYHASNSKKRKKSGEDQ